jgi:hypothetical protein
MPANLCCEHLAKSIPPEPHSFVTYVYAVLVQKVLNIIVRQRKSDIHNHRQADDLGADFEIPKRRAFCCLVRLGRRPAQLKLVAF